MRIIKNKLVVYYFGRLDYISLAVIRLHMIDQSHSVTPDWRKLFGYTRLTNVIRLYQIDERYSVIPDWRKLLGYAILTKVIRLYQIDGSYSLYQIDESYSVISDWRKVGYTRLTEVIQLYLIDWSYSVIPDWQMLFGSVRKLPDYTRLTEVSRLTWVVGRTPLYLIEKSYSIIPDLPKPLFYLLDSANILNSKHTFRSMAFMTTPL